MVLSTAELVAALQHEAQVTCHLASKVDPDQINYRPTPGQRSTIELLQYLTMMGPTLTAAIRGGGFDVNAWTAAATTAGARDLTAAREALATHAQTYAEQVAKMSDADMRVEIELFGVVATRGAHLVVKVLAACAAYRMQLFLYLKASGQAELTSSNLWSGVDVAG